MFINIIHVPAHRWVVGANEAEVTALVESVHWENILEVFWIFIISSDVEVRAYEGKLQSEPIFFWARSIMNFKCFLWYGVTKLFRSSADDLQVEVLHVLGYSILLWAAPREKQNLWISVRACWQMTILLSSDEYLVGRFIPDLLTVVWNVFWNFGDLMNTRSSDQDRTWDVCLVSEQEISQELSWF